MTIPTRLEQLRAVLWHQATGDAWTTSLLPTPPVLIGIRLSTVPADCIEPLARAGVPLSAPGGLPFDRCFRIADVPEPRLAEDGVLVLPPAPVLARMTSLPLKPLRAAIAQRTGVRLQIAVGIHLFLAPDRAILFNASDQPRSGFLHGPRRGMRAALAVDPGDVQVVPL